jgi:hypothetical protein
MKTRTRKPYEELPLIPTILAERVCSRPYTGREFRNGPSSADVRRIEAARQRMTLEEIRAFADKCEERCRAAHEAGARWFVKIANADDGREALMVWLTHWLASYLTNPSQFLTR